MSPAARVMRRRRRKDSAFRLLCMAAASFGVLLLALFMGKILWDAHYRISAAFVTGPLSERPLRTGIWPAIAGSFDVVVLTVLFAIPVGIAAAIYLEEIAVRRNALTRFIRLCIANLAGVPSIVYGLLGLALFVRWMALGETVLAGALTMSLLVLPIVILVTQEALRAVPRANRDGSLALGSTPWQAIRFQILPNALPGILTGIILAVSRAVGETAPLIVVGAASYVSAAPGRLSARYTVLPVKIFDWSLEARREFVEDAAAAILVLMVALLALNSVAIVLRARHRARPRE